MRYYLNLKDSEGSGGGPLLVLFGGGSGEGPGTCNRGGIGEASGRHRGDIEG